MRKRSISKKYNKSVDKIIEEARMRLTGIAEKFYSNYGLKDPITNSKYQSSEQGFHTTRMRSSSGKLKRVKGKSASTRGLHDLAYSSTGFKKTKNCRDFQLGGFFKKDDLNTRRNSRKFGSKKSRKMFKNRFLDHRKFLSETTEAAKLRQNIVDNKMNTFKEQCGISSSSNRYDFYDNRRKSLSSLAFKSTLKSKMSKAKLLSFVDSREKSKRRRTKFNKKIELLKLQIQDSGSNIDQLKSKIKQGNTNTVGLQEAREKLKRAKSGKLREKVLSTHLQNIGSEDKTLSIFNTKLGKMKRFNSTTIRPKDFVKGESLNLKKDLLYDEVNMHNIPANLDKDERKHLNNIWAPNFDQLDFAAKHKPRKSHKQQRTNKIDFCQIYLNEFAETNKKKLMDKISGSLLLKSKYDMIQSNLQDLEKTTKVPLSRL